jgi:PhzF family phenazine biosynthesis protein
MKIKVKRVNAFTDSVTGGNPAGVSLNTPELTSEQMRQTTKKLVVSETAFVFPSDVADYKVKFFSPEVEVDLCGHATIATFFTMALEGRLLKKNHLIQETKAGLLPVDIVYDGKNNIERVMMTQKKPIYKNIHIDMPLIADALNIDVRKIDDSLPKQIVSTGLFTFPLCVKTFEILQNMHPDFQKVKSICRKMNTDSFHVFTFETLEPESAYHARNFAPLYGIDEDPVTGTANGAISSYLHQHKIIKDKHFICEQGDIIGRPGRVYVEIDTDQVRVGGRAKIVEEKTIDINEIQ